MFFIINAILIQVEKYFGSSGAVENNLSVFPFSVKGGL